MENTFTTINPASEEILKSYAYDSDQEIEKKIEDLFSSQKVWKKKTLQERCEVLDKVKKNFSSCAEEIALLISTEMGKPLIEARAEVQKSLTLFDYYNEKAPELLEARKIQAHYKKSEIYFQPLGIILSFMPWNFPLWQVLRFAVPSWLAGNVILQKHSEITAGVALLIEKIVAESVDISLMKNLFIEPSRLEKIYQDNRIQAVTFTGSTAVGSLVAAKAAQNLKKTVLELGGSDAYIIDDTAQIEIAVEFGVKAKLVNNGQSCVAAKRFFVPDFMIEHFASLFAEKLWQKKIGSPLSSETELGPLAHQRFQFKLQNQWNEVQKLGRHFLNQAEMLRKLNSREVPSKGFFFPPKIVIVSELPQQEEVNFIKSFQEEEFFGPVVLVYAYKTESECFQRVNQSPYGLGAAWFGDPEKFKKQKIQESLDVGMVAVNEMIKSDARLPFGGVKKSGYGRELGTFGIYEFCNVQSVGWGLES